MNKKKFMAVLYIGQKRITKTIEAESYEKACDKISVFAQENHAIINDVLEV